MKRTEGEWINLGYRVDVDIADGLSGICEMSDWMDKDEMEANAKLIAAAPKLLEALERLTDYCLLSGHVDLIVEKPYVQNALLAIKDATE